MNYHADCGKGDESGPFHADCTCRGTTLQVACANSGCGFCASGWIKARGPHTWHVFRSPPIQWIIARLPGDPETSFTVFSADPKHVAWSNNLHTVEYGGQKKVWAIIAYSPTYEGLCALLDLLNVEPRS